MCLSYYKKIFTGIVSCDSICAQANSLIFYPIFLIFLLSIPEKNKYGGNSLKRKVYRRILSALMLLLVCFAMSAPQSADAAITGQETSRKLLDTVVGRYNLNYTGNTNHYASWGTNGVAGTNYIYNDTNGPYVNSSTATLSQTAGANGIKRAFLVWETRESKGTTTAVGFITPTGQRFLVSPTYAINDWRADPGGNWAYATMYCMAADVTDYVKGAGYGNYTVYNIPRYDANEHWSSSGTPGGESPGSWQLIVLEEGDGFPVRAVSLAMGSEFRMGTDYGSSLNLGSGLKSRTSGSVTGQVFFGASSAGASAPMTETVTAYDSSGGFAGNVVSNTTYSAGLYRNGSLVNRRDYQNGCIRMDLSDVTGIGNNASRIELAVKNHSWSSFFFLGLVVDIAYPDFIGEQTTTVNSAESVTVTGSFTNTATILDTGIYGGNLTVLLDSGLQAVSASATVNGTMQIEGSISGQTVTFRGSEVASMMNGSSISYTIECITANSGKTRFDNSAGFHGYLRSDSVNTGYWIDRMWTASSFGIPMYTMTLEKGEGIESVTGAGTYAYGSRVDIGASLETGYHWKGWTGSYVTEQRDYSFVMPAKNISMLAEGEANTYTITFDPNGGGETGHLEDIVTQYDAELELPDGAEYYVKYTLDGVNITKDVLSGTIMLNAEGVLIEPGEELPEETEEEESDNMLPDIEETSEEETDGDGTEEVGEVQEEPAEIVATAMDEAGAAVPEESGTAINEAGAAALGAAETATDGAGDDWDEEPQPDRKAYASVYMGWSLKEGRTGWEPLWEPLEVTVAELAKAAGVENINGAVITLYAVWDDSPWIHAVNLYYTLEQAQSGYITEAELLSHATALDREDGSPIEPGVHEDGTSFTIPDYLPTDFTQFLHTGSCTENLTAVDSVGSVYAKQITVHVVDTSPTAVKPEGTTRFITEYYYSQSYENGGLEDNSLWRTDPEYAAVLREAFENIEQDTPTAAYYFTRGQILEMQEYVAEHGVGNSREPDALQGFYQRFLAPNQIHY